MNEQPPFQFAARTTDVALKKTLCIKLREREILLCHTSDGFYAIDNLCSHADAQLSGGKLKGNRILCPLHGAAFDVRDGAALTRPASKPLRSYPLLIEGEDILIAIDGIDN